MIWKNELNRTTLHQPITPALFFACLLAEYAFSLRTSLQSKPLGGMVRLLALTFAFATLISISCQKQMWAQVRGVSGCLVCALPLDVSHELLQRHCPDGRKVVVAQS